MPEGHGLQPLDAHVNAVAVVAARDIEVLALGCAAADEDGIVSFIQQLAHAVHGRVQPQVRAHVDDVVDFLVQHRRRQAERGNVGAHQAAGLVQRFVDDALVSQRHQVVDHRQGGTARTDQGDALAVLLLRRHRQP